MRVYLAVTFGELAAAAASGEVGPAPMLAFAVTPALREWYASGDAEQLSHAAMTDAARQCLRLLARDPALPARRVVVAADIADASVALAPDVHPAAVTLTAAVRLAEVASVHVDPPEITDQIRAAAGLINAADAGDLDAGFVVDGVEDHDLHWYATQEIATLLDTSET